MTKQLTIRLTSILLVVAVLAGVGAFLSVQQNENARDWLQITGSASLGGSDIYANGVLFARAVPVLIGFGIALGLLQAVIRRPQGSTHNGAIRRHEPSVVIMHWLIFIGMLVLWLTAALMLPGVLFEWTEKLLGAERFAELENTLKVDRPLSLSTLYALHYIGSAVVLFVCFNHLTLHLVAGDRGLIPKKGDVGQALAIILGYTGVFGPEKAVFKIKYPTGIRKALTGSLAAIGIKPPKPAGKYLATERLASYWPAAILIGILVLTGVVKAMHYLYPIPATGRQFLTIVHDVSGVILLIWLVAHVAAITLVPENWPLLKSMVTTRISRQYVEKYLPQWLEELKTAEKQGN